MKIFIDNCILLCIQFYGLEFIEFDVEFGVLALFQEQKL